MLNVGKPLTKTDSYAVGIEELSIATVRQLIVRAKNSHKSDTVWHEHILNVGNGDLVITLESTNAYLHATIYYSEIYGNNPLTNKLFEACLMECNSCSKTPMPNSDQLVNES